MTEKKPIDVVFLDMDGVIVDFVQAALDVHHRRDLTPEDITEYDMAGIMGLTEKEFWALIDAAGPPFWRDMPVYPWFEPLMAHLKRVAEKIIFVTTPGWHHASLLGKKYWLNEHFGHRFRDYILTSHKHYLAGTPRSVLIDDSPHNVKAFEEAGGAAVLFPRPWNGTDIPDGTDLVTWTVERAKRALFRAELCRVQPMIPDRERLAKALEPYVTKEWIAEHILALGSDVVSSIGGIEVEQGDDSE